LNIETGASGSLEHQVDPRLLALLAEASHGVEAAGDAHEESSEAGVDDEFVALLLDFEDDAVHDVVVAVLFGGLVEVLLRVDVLDVVAVGDLDEEGVGDGDGVDLDVDVDLDEASVLLVGVGDEVHSGHVAEGRLVIGVDLVHLEPVLEQLTIHTC
jgi:hypothetical protein